MKIFMLQMDGQIDGSAGKNNNVSACFKTIIFQLFNVFSKIFTNLLLPINFNLHETCIPSPSPKLTGFPVITTSLYSSALKKQKIILAKLPDFPSSNILLQDHSSLHRQPTCLLDYPVLFLQNIFHLFQEPKYLTHDVPLQQIQLQNYLLL